MSSEYDYPERTPYPALLNILILWGRSHLLEPEDTASLHELCEQWDEVARETSIASSLSAGLEMLAGQVQEALDVFQCPQSLDSISDRDWRAQAAIEVLDYVVFLSEALEYFPLAETFPEDFRQESDELLRRITVDNPPSGLRLIPLNDWRREVLERIPSKCQYLFPWYASWAEVPADTLEILVDEWANLSRGHIDIEGLDEGTVSHLLAELSTDQDLLDHIRKEAHLTLLIPQAIEESIALRLFFGGSKQAARMAVSDSVEAAGLAACASKIIDGPIHSETDRLERLFRAAFCGPFLTDAQRLELLDEVEKEIQTIRPSELNGTDLDTVYRWSQGQLEDGELAQQVFTRWNEQLNEASKEVEPHEDLISEFWSTVSKVRTSPSPIVAPGFIHLKRKIIVEPSVAPDFPEAIAREIGGRAVPVRSSKRPSWGFDEFRAGSSAGDLIGIIAADIVTVEQVKEIESQGRKWSEINRDILASLAQDNYKNRIFGLERLLHANNQDPYVAFNLAWLFFFEGDMISALEHLKLAEQGLLPEFLRMANQLKVAVNNAARKGEPMPDHPVFHIWKLRCIEADAMKRIKLMKEVFFRTHDGYVAYEVAREYKHLGYLPHRPLDYSYYEHTRKWAKIALEAQNPVDEEMRKWPERILSTITETRTEIPEKIIRTIGPLPLSEITDDVLRERDFLVLLKEAA